MLPKRFIAIIFFVALAVMPACVLHAQWVPTNGPKSVSIGCFAVSGSNLLAAAVYGGVYLTTDNGITWMADTNDSLNSVLTFAVIDTTIFAGTLGGGVYRSTDNGVSWRQVNNGLATEYVNAFAVNGTTLYAGGLGVFRSTDNGDSWTATNNDVQGDVFALAVSGTNLFAGTRFDGIFRSTDSGATWAVADNGLTNFTNFEVDAFAVSGTSIFAGFDDGGLFRSTDSGANWIAINNGLTTAAVYAIAVSGTSIFVGLDGGGVFRSIDNGDSWSADTIGLENKLVQALVVSGTNLFAGTIAGIVWRSPISESGVTETKVVQNEHNINSYPNPFSQSTQITSMSQAAGYAEVSIVNLLGVEVARLFVGELGAGEHSFMWSNPTGLPDGTYECLVRMNGQMQSLPLILLH